MGTRYSHMALADRLHMQALLSAGKSGRFIAKTLGFSTATISRELGKVRARMDSECGYWTWSWTGPASTDGFRLESQAGSGAWAA